MSTTIRNKKDLTKLKKDLHGKDIVIYSDDIVINSDRLLNMIVNIDETGYQYVLTSTVMRTGAESRNRPYI